MSLADAAISAFLQALLLGGVPFFGYVIYQRWRHKRTFRDSAGRAGLQLGEPRYILYSLVFALIVVAILVIWSWLIHAAGNVTMALLVAIRTAL